MYFFQNVIFLRLKFFKKFFEFLFLTVFKKDTFLGKLVYASFENQISYLYLLKKFF